jgi:hypothetical protein
MKVFADICLEWLTIYHVQGEKVHIKLSSDTTNWNKNLQAIYRVTFAISPNVMSFSLIWRRKLNYKYPSKRSTSSKFKIKHHFRLAYEQPVSNSFISGQINHESDEEAQNQAPNLPQSPTAPTPIIYL